MIRLYTAAYGNSGMNARQVLEEMVCDAMGKMNAFATEETSTVAGEVGQFLRDLRKTAMETRTEGQKNNAQEGVKHSREMDGYDYTKSFEQQLEDYNNKEFPKTDALVLGGTPEVLRKIGLAGIPLVINQQHVNAALNGNYRGTQQEILDHSFTISEFSKLPEKIADPVAVIQDKRTGKAAASESVVDVIVEMTAKSGKQVLCAVQVGSSGHINGIRVDANKVATVHGNTDTVTRLVDAINEHTTDSASVYYVNKEKTTNAIQRAGNPIPGGLNDLDGFTASISESRSVVKNRIKDATQSQQFKRWFGDWQNDPAHASKVVNADGTPKVVYHGSTADFNTFSLKYLGTNGTNEGYGFYFTDKKEIAEGYSHGTEAQRHQGADGKLFEVYLDIKHPLSDTEVTMTKSQFRRFLMEMNKQVDEDGEPLDFLSNYGDVAWEGLQNVINSAMEAEYDGSDSDVNMIHSIINGCGSMETVFDVLRKTTGYDGIIVKNAQWGGDQTIYVAFHPNQIKSATDNIGTFDGKNLDIRYSRELDSEYMELAKDPEGNRRELQEMVDQAAEAAGYEYKRNTRRKHSPANDVPWQMFVRGVDKYQGNYGDYTYYATDKGATSIDEIMPKLRELAEEFYGETVSDEEINPPDIVMSAGVWDDMDFVQYAWDNYFEGEMDRTGKVPAVVTEDGMIVIDEDFSRVKSGDTVEYDDNGKVIPLSERFNSDKSDIRYSRELETVEALKRQNEILQKQRDYWKEQTKTHKKEVPAERLLLLS